jgi:hypothetical protein
MARPIPRWIVAAVCMAASSCKPTPQQRARAEAEADLAGGKAVIMTSSGIARFPLTPDVDRETGLPIRDNGCVYDPAYGDAYNEAVRAWVRDHGPPASSVKARILDEAVVDDALRRGADLFPGVPVQAPDGRRIELRGEVIHVEGGAFATAFQRPLGLGKIDRVRFAWAPNGQVLVRVEGPSREGLTGGVARVQIDPGCRCFVQVLR